MLRSQALLITGLAVYRLLLVGHLHAQKSMPGEVVVHPAEIADPPLNPYMGLGLWAGPRGLGNNEKDYTVAESSVYLPALQRFLGSFAARYDHAGTPIILLQTMGYGHWADFATWYSKYPFPSVQVKHDVLTRLLEVYIHRFNSIQLLQMAGSDWDGDSYPTLDSYLYLKALDVAAANIFGLIWTGFIDGN